MVKRYLHKITSEKTTKMKFDLKSGKKKEYKKMTKKEKEEVDNDFIKGLLISGGILGVLKFLDK